MSNLNKKLHISTHQIFLCFISSMEQIKFVVIVLMLMRRNMLAEFLVSDILKRRLRQELLNSMQEEWQQIQQDDTDNLISRPKRCRAVSNNRDDHTFY